MPIDRMSALRRRARDGAPGADAGRRRVAGQGEDACAAGVPRGRRSGRSRVAVLTFARRVRHIFS